MNLIKSSKYCSLNCVSVCNFVYFDLRTKKVKKLQDVFWRDTASSDINILESYLPSKTTINMLLGFFKIKLNSLNLIN